jgi:hypothetical protein
MYETLSLYMPFSNEKKCLFNEMGDKEDATGSTYLQIEMKKLILKNIYTRIHEQLISE